MSFAKLEAPERPRPAPRPTARPEAAEGDAARDYLFIGVAALMVVGLVMLARSAGNPFVLVAVLPALLALLIRATVLPALFLAGLVYLAAFPDGLPIAPPPAIVSRSHFRVVDLVFVAAVAVYFVAYFRLASLKYRILATTAYVPKSPGESKSPAVPVARRGVGAGGDESARAFAQLLALTLAAAVAWQALAVLAVEPLLVPPLRVDLLNGNDTQSRFLLLAGAVGFGALGFGALVGYWRASKVRPAVARQYLLDLAWRDNRRELNRREKWRAWGRGQLTREPFRVPVRAVARTAAFCLATVVAMALGAFALQLAVRLITGR